MHPSALTLEYYTQNWIIFLLRRALSITVKLIVFALTSGLWCVWCESGWLLRHLEQSMYCTTEPLNSGILCDVGEVLGVNLLSLQSYITGSCGCIPSQKERVSQVEHPHISEWHVLLSCLLCAGLQIPTWNNRIALYVCSGWGRCVLYNIIYIYI